MSGLRNMHVPEDAAECGTAHKHGRISMYIQGSPAEIQNPTHSVSDIPQHDYPAACVIAQQYSTSTFVQWRFHSRKEKFVKPFRNVVNPIFFYGFKNIVFDIALLAIA